VTAHEVPPVQEPEHVWVPNGDGDEVLERASFSVPLPSDMGGDGWSVDVSESEPVTFHWGNGDYGIHITRNSLRNALRFKLTS
jgi:hypothetical protein